jgi:hypothetical protein
MFADSYGCDGCNAEFYFDDNGDICEWFFLIDAADDSDDDDEYVIEWDCETNITSISYADDGGEAGKNICTLSGQSNITPQNILSKMPTLKTFG